MRTEWTRRVVTDTRGTAGAIILDEADVEIAAEYLYAAAYDEN